jgi:hypothetical protein
MSVHDGGFKLCSNLIFFEQFNSLIARIDKNQLQCLI